MSMSKIAGSMFGGLAVLFACSANNSAQPSQLDPGSGGTGQGGGSASGPGGTSGKGSGGSSGGGFILDGGGVSDAPLGDAPCQALSEEAKTSLAPADIIWAVDTSGSMGQEAIAVQASINAFSTQIVQSGIDVHVVMIAGYPVCLFGICGPGICVPAPLGSGQCPPNGSDTKPPQFFHHPQAVVNSVDGANVLVTQFPSYRQMLRPGTLKYVVVVTDDDSADTGGSGDPGPYNGSPPPAGVGPDGAADKFIADFTALDPMMRNAMGNRAWSLSSVYAPTQCQNAAAIGLTWKAIVDKTGGIHGDICACTQDATCLQTFQAVLNQLATKVIQGSKPLECEWAIPAAPSGQTFDPNKVNVEVIDQSNGMKDDVYHVADAAACDPNAGGWYYDNNQTPTRVIACPASCTKIKGLTQGKVNVLFGCATKNIPPPV